MEGRERIGFRGFCSFSETEEPVEAGSMQRSEVVPLALWRAGAEAGDAALLGIATGTELVGVTTTQEAPLARMEPGRYLLKVGVADLCLNPGTYSLGLGIAARERSVDHIAEAAQIEIVPSEASMRKELHRVWAALTPHTDFQLRKL